MLINYLLKQPGIERAIDMDDLSKVILNTKIREKLVNGYNPAQERGNTITSAASVDRRF